VGSEGKGISRLVGEHCDLHVAIPITSKTESLNASVAASIVLYQIAVNRNF
jgi:23S rRNA (guanosine2251-2'-O)-methyltransferase